MSSRSDVVRAIAHEIEQYLLRHPDAADSAEGIRAWWVSVPLEPEVLAAALLQLEARGVVVRTEREGVATIYSRASRGHGSLH